MVIVTGTNYNTNRPYSTECRNPGQAHIARYAWGDDYHHVILSRLEALVAWMRDASSGPFDARIYVDTGPVQERVYARHAGIGWIGKNTCVISPTAGSWLFLGEDHLQPAARGGRAVAGSMRHVRAVSRGMPDSSPRGPGSTRFHALCVVLTIELRGAIPDQLLKGVGAHVYGCDVCQEVCPWNAVAPRSEDPAWQPRSVWDGSDATSLAGMSDAELAAALEGSAMRRAKVAGLRRNIDVVLGNKDVAATGRLRHT